MVKGGISLQSAISGTESPTVGQANGESVPAGATATVLRPGEFSSFSLINGSDQTDFNEIGAAASAPLFTLWLMLISSSEMNSLYSSQDPTCSL